jgi:thiamine biosynthesis lipoprotein
VTTEAPVARTRHVESSMGTVFTVDIRDPGDWTDALADVVRWLHFVDATFSTYRADSAISRIGRGELRVADADPYVAEVLELCVRAQQVTDGYFTSVLRGRLDPTGLVKGWAIERASALLREHGSANHAVNGGGDMQLAGEASPGRPWTVGIADPHNPAQTLSTVNGRDLAVATSGVAERGTHIVDPFTGRPAEALASATVVGASLTDVDAYATAACAMGPRALRWLESVSGMEGLLVASDGSMEVTCGWPGRQPDQRLAGKPR